MFPIVYAILTTLCQHSTTDLARGVMRNERKQSALSKACSFKHSKTTNSFFVFNLSPTAPDKTNLFQMRGVDFRHFNTCCTFNVMEDKLYSNLSNIWDALILKRTECNRRPPSRDGSKSFFASPSQVTSHFLASPSQVTSHFRASPSQVTSQLVRLQVKSSHKSFGPNTSQVTSLFVQVQVKSHIISSTPVIRRGI